MKKHRLALFKSLAGLSINISAAWFISVFIGPNVSLPNDLQDVIVLILNTSFGIIFLIVSVLLEKELKS